MWEKDYGYQHFFVFSRCFYTFFSMVVESRDCPVSDKENIVENWVQAGA